MTEEATALISRAGRAIVRSGEAYYVLTADDPETRPADATHWIHLRGLHPDSALVPADTHPFPDVRARMLDAWREQLGLDLLLLCLDRDHDEDFRRETCAVLEELFVEVPWLRERLREIVFGTEPPPEADLLGAKALAAAAGSEEVGRLLGEVIDAREDIAAALAAWQRAVKTLATPAEWTEAMVAAERLRAVARAVIALRAQAPDAWEELRSWCRTHLEPALEPISADASALIERWLAALDKGQAATREVLAAEGPDALARLIRERLTASEPSEATDRRRCDALVRAAALSAQSSGRAPFAEAVLSLLGELLLRPDAAPPSTEWPAGLFAIARHVPWTPAELDTLRRLLVSFLHYVRHDRAWPLGAAPGSSLGSVVLEVHQTARFAQLNATEHRTALVGSVERLLLLPRARVEVDPELGCLLGLLASYGEAEAVEAAELLRRIDLGARDRVLDAAAREQLRWTGSVGTLVDALLQTIGGLGNIRQLRDPPTAQEQRWAALAARRLAVPTAEREAQINLLLVPEPAAAKRTIKAPAWVRKPVAA